jgi:hypothetical protein
VNLKEDLDLKKRKMERKKETKEIS